MVEVVELAALSTADLLGIEDLAAAATAADHKPALSDDHWIALHEGASDAVVRLAARADGHTVAFAQLVRGTDARSLELIVDPAFRADDTAPLITRAALARAAAWGPGPVRVLVTGVDPSDDSRLASLGFTPERDVVQLRVPLPIADPTRWPAGVEVRTFRPGVDEDQWLAVNNRAFATHPEQSGWDRATLVAHMQQPWFDPEGFVMAFDDQGLAGFCWTKIHVDEGLGEIYVIGVDPGRQGVGLGRALVVAGLASIAARGITTGMLYVEGDNVPAFGLYASLGFVEHQRDRWYLTEVAG